ncbi:MAG: cytochrome c [Deltaproteobacteria bacterium]|nr:cytochrome c [Deltaproteobacteria bacterium]
MRPRTLSLFWATVLSLAAVYLLLAVAAPYVSMWMAGRDQPLPIPRAAMAMYLVLALAGAAIYISTDDEKLREFLRPLQALLRGNPEGHALERALRLLFLAAGPLLVGAAVYSQTAPAVQTPTALRIQHPTIPGQFERLRNPFRTNDEAMQRHIAEGRILYQKNCRPCHGTKADGGGPMAWGFRLKPANFRDPGTIATVVEAYAFWRVKEGARGLPAEASPWDSAMPAWKDDLTDEQIWKIILAEYDIAGVAPRQPEKIE